MIQFTEEQDKAAREWNEAFDYRALRNGVQCGNILMHHLDEVNKRAMELYAAQQVAAERERIKNKIRHSKAALEVLSEALELIDSL